MKKLHLKFGSVEIDLETADLKADLDHVLAAIQKFQPVQQSKPDGGAAAEGSADSSNEEPKPPRSVAEQHMNSYVAKLSANTGRKIIAAAALHLSLNDGKDTFTRDELFSRAREARDWKSDYVNTQSTNVARMVKAGELIEKSSNVYALPSKELEAAAQVLSA